MEFLFFFINMSQLNLQQLLEQNSNLQTQIQQRLSSLSIQLVAFNSQPQDYGLIHTYLNAHQQWKSRQAEKLLHLQEQIVSRGQKAEQLKRYQETISQLLNLLKEKEQQVAVLQNKGRSYKRAGFNIKKLNNDQEYPASTVALMKELRLKAQLEQEVSRIQQASMEKEVQGDQMDNLQTSLIQVFLNEVQKNKRLEKQYGQLLEQMEIFESQQIQKKYKIILHSIQSQQQNGIQQIATSAKTISQTSDQD